MRRIFASILGYQVASTPVRRLILDGNIDSLSAHPYAVALMICEAPSYSQANYVCSILCSGSLIAPNAVVSAAHCVMGETPSFTSLSNQVNVDDLYILAGSTDYDFSDRSSGSRLVKVKQGRHPGYYANIRFPDDGDVLLLELEECIEPIEDQISYVKVATVVTEPANDNCQSITVSGFGQISNAPDVIKDDDGRRRSITDTIHSHSVCREAYVAARYRWTEANQGSADDSITQTVIPEMFLCTGGSSVHSVCLGDSGGGYFAPLGTNEMQVVGVVSFGAGAGAHAEDYCTTSPDYSSRLSFRAKWILDQLRADFSTCPSWDASWEKSFASWPLPEITKFSDLYISSRCPSKWQCKDGTQCIDLSLVCNDENDCNDGSDEDSSYCGMDGERESGRSGNHLRREFDAFLGEKSDWITARLEKLQSSSNYSSPGVIVLGVLPAAVKPMKRLVNPDIQYVSNQKREDWPTDYSGTPTTCDLALDSYNTALADADAQDTRDDQWDASYLSRACIDLEICSDIGDGNQDLVDAKDVCDSLKEFLNWNMTVVDYASNFNERFDASCRNPLPAGFDPEDKGSTRAGTSFNMLLTIHLALLGSIAVYL